jgi:hypothetical protein
MRAVLHEVVATVSGQVELWRLDRERRQLMREFPPRFGASAFWPAVGLLCIGVALSTASLHRRAPRAVAAPVVAPPAAVDVGITSDPLGAHAVATWPEGSAEGTTPFHVYVPRGTRLSIFYQRANYQPYSIDVIANTSQTALGTLSPEPE